MYQYQSTHRKKLRKLYFEKCRIRMPRNWNKSSEILISLFLLWFNANFPETNFLEFFCEYFCLFRPFIRLTSHNFISIEINKIKQIDLLHFKIFLHSRTNKTLFPFLASICEQRHLWNQ